MFKIGEKVVFIDELGEGVIIKILQKNLILVEDEHGFHRSYPSEKIALKKVPDDKLANIKNLPIEKAKVNSKKTPEKHNIQIEVIDLHIHELMDNHSRMTNTEIIQFQMQHLKKTLERLMQKRVKVVHIVHGVGEGVLRNEVRQYLRKFLNCEVNDLSYTRNGYGATEFKIRYKGNVL